MATSKAQRKTRVAGRMAAGATNGPCGRDACDRDVFFKPNRLGSDGVYYHPECTPKGVTLAVEGSIPKADTVAAWRALGLGPDARAEAREVERKKAPAKK